MSIIDEIKKIPKLYHAKGCSISQIKDAQKSLGITFPDEYIDYVKEYGAISFYGTEWMGLNVDGYLNVVEATKQEREINDSFPIDCFVIENLGTDGIIVIVDENGIVYSFHSSKKEKICNSLVEYLQLCLERNN
ncbi:MAG: SMI1/KNR4 family protein [Butyrivibrio sp.]|uniref:SMI1/KNR4 family protein n=1 Tax=Butyrivibrio sp. TaxID=28121 RepID=UPI0025EC9800|nr:SMI1/KNR4 family protein [Butyrivibrio sp.]MCR5769705.1 SMI1/KNR4 family protein [Butyrivibrio sp.]